MILGAPLPWENEPGYEGSGPTLKVLSHKSRVQSRTVRFAMITWVENKFQAETMEHIWKEISQAYWKHNGTKVLGYVKTWAKETPGLLCFGMTPYCKSYRVFSALLLQHRTIDTNILIQGVVWGC